MNNSAYVLHHSAEHILGSLATSVYQYGWDEHTTVLIGMVGSTVFLDMVIDTERHTLKDDLHCWLEASMTSAAICFTAKGDKEKAWIARERDVTLRSKHCPVLNRGRRCHHLPLAAKLAAAGDALP